jgi:tetratricopeptide (TPR) repeat protein
VLGYILMTRAWHWTESRQLLDQALADAPGNAQARMWSSLWFAVHGRLPEARMEADAAIALDPANAAAHAQLASVHYLAGRYPETLTTAEHASQLNPKLQVAHYWRARALMMTGPASDVAVARADELAAWQTFSQDHRMALMNQYSALAMLGGASRLADFWLAEVAEGRPRAVNQYERAVWQMWSGRPAEALDELAAAVRTRPYRVIYAAADPIFESLRGNPGFASALLGLGLPVPPPAPR